MRFSRPLCYALLPLLASCQVFTSTEPTPDISLTRMQGEISQQAGQLVFRPCKEQRRFLINEAPESEFMTDVNSMIGDGKLFADLRAQLKSTSKTGFDGQIVLGELYRLQAEGHGCNDINFSRTLLRATGNEPGWSVAVSNQGLVLNRQGKEPQALPYIEEQLPEGRLSLSSEANGQRLDLWVTKQRCMDGMSGAINHMTAELRLNGEVFRGCAYLGGARNN